MSDIEGWFWPEEGSWYERTVRALPSQSKIVEVGCWKGRSISFIAAACRERRHTLWCVDDWSGSTDRFSEEYRARLAAEDVEAVFRGNLTKLDIDASVIRGRSPTAAARFEDGTIDLVFLDASHDEASVARDLDAWWRTIRPGGRLCGHDFDDKTAGVVAAVNAFRKVHGLELGGGAGRIWFVDRQPAPAHAR